MHSGVISRVIKAFADIRTPLAPMYSGWEKKNFWLRLAGLKIAKDGVAIGSGFQCIDGMEEGVIIERYAAIGHNLKIWNFNNVQIGPFCMIAAGVTISNGWHDKSTFIPSSGPTIIGGGVLDWS